MAVPFVPCPTTDIAVKDTCTSDFVAYLSLCAVPLSLKMGAGQAKACILTCMAPQACDLHESQALQNA